MVQRIKRRYIQGGQSVMENFLRACYRCGWGSVSRKNGAIQLATVTVWEYTKGGGGGSDGPQLPWITPAANSSSQKLRTGQYHTKICEDLSVSRRLVFEVKSS